MSGPKHPLVGEYVVYTAYFGSKRGVVTGVNVEAGLVFVRYGSDWESTPTRADDRLRIVNGGPVTDALKRLAATKGES